MMSQCPSSGSITDCIKNHFIEWFAVTSAFVTVQYLAATFFKKPTRVPILLGGIIPLSYYTFTILDHQTKSSCEVVHGLKSQRQRQALIILVTLLIIRAYQNTQHAVTYRWGVVTLIIAKFMTHLPNLPRSQS